MSRRRFATLDLRFAILGLVLPCFMGCITGPQNPAATQPATQVDPATTQPSYWLEQPESVVVESGDFQKLWSACEQTARDFLFKIDRVDYRSGVLSTEPMVSAQFFEPWRRDNRTLYDVVESSIATIRRTARFEFQRAGENRWRVTPKVLVERQSLAERRVTSVVYYRGVFGSVTGTRQIGTRESDVGIMIPGRYWYPLRRDIKLEQALARAIRRKLPAERQHS
ncbi:hypothetical protein [Fontivita pretiosa]|uniref:hypothetical protein n=1 Tax=Fontivita pretiosa TaxID=2989684 RepID=UPI003D169BF6